MNVKDQYGVEGGISERERKAIDKLLRAHQRGIRKWGILGYFAGILTVVACGLVGLAVLSATGAL